MLVLNKQSNENMTGKFPKILALNSAGDPTSWITYERSAYYYAKEKVLWSAGAYEVVLRGGTNAKTGLQSKLMIDTIISIASDQSPKRWTNKTPTLSNKTLFSRDRSICAYCGGIYKDKDLTRDHIIPSSRNGKDIWENVVAACTWCNQNKDDKTPEEAGMTLLYLPYVPSFNEHLILQNRHILADQMEFLLKGVSKNSRLHTATN
jgi:5-methylcytosine-specific restriction endonuclease McrA